MTTLGCLASYSLMSALFNVIIGGWVCVQNVRCTLLEPAPLLLQAAVVSAASASVMAAAVQRKCFIGAPSSGARRRGMWWSRWGWCGGDDVLPVGCAAEAEVGHAVGDQGVPVAAEQIDPEVDDPAVGAVAGGLDAEQRGPDLAAEQPGVPIGRVAALDDGGAGQDLDAVALVEQLVPGAMQVGAFEAGDVRGRDPGGLEADRLAVGRPQPGESVHRLPGRDAQGPRLHRGGPQPPEPG